MAIREVSSDEWADFANKFKSYQREADEGDAMESVYKGRIVARVTGYKTGIKRYYVNDAKLYAVSVGNGNDGYSMTWPNYHVWTDEPWVLARCAALACVGAGQYRDYVAEHVEIDGDEEYEISFAVFEGPDGETEFGAAWLCGGVQRADKDSKNLGLVYIDLEDAFGPEIVSAVRTAEASS